MKSEPLRVRIARIVAGHVTRGQWEANPSEHKDNLRMADEILFEMRNPTDRMISDGKMIAINSCDDAMMIAAWQAMIDAARGPRGM